MKIYSVMKLEFLLTHTSKLIKTIKSKELGVADSINSYLRRNKAIGSKDRKFITEITIFYLKNKTLLDYLYSMIENDCEIPLSLFILSIFKNQNILADNTLLLDNCNKIFRNNDLDSQILSDYFTNQNYVIYKVTIKRFVNYIKLLDDTARTTNSFKYLSLRFSISLFLLKELNKSWEVSQLYDVLEELNKKSNIHIWTNHLDIVKNDLNLNEIKYRETGTKSIEITERKNLTALRSYKTGKFEIQDISSQIISEIVINTDANSILDACAGAGGKSLYFAANSKKEIFAYDIRKDALEELTKRAKRLKIKGITTITSDEFKKNPLFDLVFIDSPCSGFGTIKRDPALKHKLNESKIKSFHRKQLKLLNFYRNFVAVDSLLVYATCSLLYSENQAVIDTFLKNNPNYSFTDINQHYKDFSINNRSEYLINPTISGGDGFYIAILKKVSNID